MNYSTLSCPCQHLLTGTLSSSFQIKAQRSGFDLVAKNLDDVGALCLHNAELIIKYDELVTRTGFEPMLKA